MQSITRVTLGFCLAAACSMLGSAQSSAALPGCTGYPVGWPCDDANPCTIGDTCQLAGVCAGTASAPTPPEIVQVNLSRSGSDAILRWTVPDGSVGIDVVRGKLTGGRVSPLGVGQACLGRGLDPSMTEITDYSNPPVGTGYWYLVRGTNDCGFGVWGSQRENGALTARLTECGCTPDPNATADNRYVDHIFTVTDRATCLEWEKKGSVSSLHEVNATYNWYEATGFVPYPPNWIGAVNEERFAGHGDWRLPTSWGTPALRTGQSPEIESLLLTPCPGYPNPCIDPVFGPVPTGTVVIYWSGTGGVGPPYGPTYAWAVDFVTGGWAIDGKRFYFDHVRAVRGGF